MRLSEPQFSLWAEVMTLLGCVGAGGPCLWRRNFCYTVLSYGNGVWVSDLSVGSGSGPWSETRSVSSGFQTAPSSVACWTESAWLGDGHGVEVVPREAVMVTMVRA